MSSLVEIVKEIKKRQDIILTEKDLALLKNIATKRTRLGHITRAKEDLKDLYYEYRKEIQANSLFVLVTGTQKDKYMKIAKEKYSCFTLDGEIFYKELADQIPKELYTNVVSSPALFDFFAAKFGDRALEIDIIGHMPLLFKREYSKRLNSKEDLIALMKVAFNECIGSEVIGLDAIDRITKLAVNSNFSGSVVPILLSTDDTAYIQDLSKNLLKITNNVFLVTTGAKNDKALTNRAVENLKSVNEDNVLKSLTKIKKLL